MSSPPPLSSPPPGGDEDRGPLLLAVFWTETSLSVLIVASRFYSRSAIKALGADDWAMLATLVIPTAPSTTYSLTAIVDYFDFILWLWHRLRSRWRGSTSLLPFAGPCTRQPNSEAQLDQPALRYHESWAGQDLCCLSHAKAHRGLCQSSKDISVDYHHPNVHFQRSMLCLNLCAMHSDPSPLGTCARSCLLGPSYAR